MAHYAEQGAKFLAQTGGGADDLARVVAKNRLNGSLNPNAQLRRPVTVEQVLADRMVAAPLTRSMCSPVSTGAAAIVVASAALCRQLGARPVRILGTGIASADPRSPVDAVPAGRGAGVRGGRGRPGRYRRRRTARRRRPGRARPDGGGGPVRRRPVDRSAALGATALGGRLPVNPSGGLISRGPPARRDRLRPAGGAHPAAPRPQRRAAGRVRPARARPEQRRRARRRRGGRGGHHPRRPRLQLVSERHDRESRFAVRWMSYTDDNGVSRVGILAGRHGSRACPRSDPARPDRRGRAGGRGRGRGPAGPGRSRGARG